MNINGNRLEQQTIHFSVYTYVYIYIYIYIVRICPTDIQTHVIWLINAGTDKLSHIIVRQSELKSIFIFKHVKYIAP